MKMDINTHKWIMKMDIGTHTCINKEQLIDNESYVKNGKTRFKGFLKWIKNDNEIINVPVTNVKINPESDYNVLSLSVIMERGFKVHYWKNRCGIYLGDKLVLEGERRYSEYVINTLKNQMSPDQENKNLIVDSDKAMSDENGKNTSPLSEKEINVDKDDRFFKYECDSFISSMDTIIMNSLIPYFESEHLKPLKTFPVSKCFNDKETLKRSAKTTAGSFKHEQRKQPQDSLLLLQPSVSLQADTVYGCQLDNSTNIEKIKCARKKQSKHVMTYQHYLKLQLDEGSARSDAVLIKPLLKIYVTTCFMCLNSEFAPTYPSFGRKIAHVINVCPEDKQKFLQVFSCLLHMDNSVIKKKKQFANNYDLQPSAKEQMSNQLIGIILLSLQAWFGDRIVEEQEQFFGIQRQAIADRILEEIMLFYFKTKRRCRLINWKRRRQKGDIQYI